MARALRGTPRRRALAAAHVARAERRSRTRAWASSPARRARWRPRSATHSSRWRAATVPARRESSSQRRSSIRRSRRRSCSSARGCAARDRRRGDRRSGRASSVSFPALPRPSRASSNGRACSAQRGDVAGADRASRAPHPQRARRARSYHRRGASWNWRAARFRQAMMSRHSRLPCAAPLVAARAPRCRANVQPPHSGCSCPMDDAQTNHLKAYGLTYNALKTGEKAEWLLNYRGGAFLLPDAPELRRRAALDGITVRADHRRAARDAPRARSPPATWRACRSRRRRRSRSTRRPRRRRGTTP